MHCVCHCVVLESEPCPIWLGTLVLGWLRNGLGGSQRKGPRFLLFTVPGSHLAVPSGHTDWAWACVFQSVPQSCPGPHHQDKALGLKGHTWEEQAPWAASTLGSPACSPTWGPGVRLPSSATGSGCWGPHHHRCLHTGWETDLGPPKDGGLPPRDIGHRT